MNFKSMACALAAGLFFFRGRTGRPISLAGRGAWRKSDFLGQGPECGCAEAHRVHAAICADARKILAAVSSRERIPTVQKRGPWLYNFWQDATHVRGVWRRTTMEEYKKRVRQNGETILDLDQLAKDEKENWVWRGLNCRYPEYTQCLLTLSRGGADATVTREWDLNTRSFVKDGFPVEGSQGQRHGSMPIRCLCNPISDRVRRPNPAMRAL